MSKITPEVAAKPEHIQLIRQARPVMNPEIAEKDISSPEIGGAYAVYNVGLNELKAARVSLKAAPLLRVQEVTSARKIAASYEMSASAREAAIPTVHADAAYLTKLNASFQAADKVAAAAAAPLKMRIINIPALHTEAYWLHADETNRQDMVVPIHSFFFPEGVPVPYATFIQKMTEAAKTIPDTSNNELGG